MLEAGVKVGFFLEAHNLLKMCVVNMSINTEKALEYRLHDFPKILWEGGSKFLRKNGFIVKLDLNPVHQILDIFRCRNLDGFLDLNSISPSVLKPGKKLLSSVNLQSSTKQIYLPKRQISYLGPADIVGHVVGVQNSIRVP
jgi:hypothetical protein